MARKKYCNRCAHEMWYSEEDKRWYCTNPKCVKYKPQPEPEPEPAPTPEDNGEEDSDGKTVKYVPDKTEDNGEEDEEA